ncbi:MAG: diguanylate cyclase [Rhodobacteraceae bacterium]|nr:diguanylate cyclase [Paracoccaceae bacterium]
MSSFLDRLKENWVYLLIAAGTALTFMISAELELFEEFYEFSRAHEDWELDELAVLILNLTAGLMVALIVRSRQLSKLATERDNAERQAQQVALNDALTGLPNRRAFMDHLQSLGRTGMIQEGIIMMLDLDRFKAVNDVHGHAYGDLVLVRTAERLLAELEDGDLVARLGGDEFAIALAPGASVERAENIAKHILASVSQPIIENGVHLSIGTSIGLARLTAEQVRASALQRADHALYSAKKSGRGQFAWFDTTLEKKARERRALELDLQHAVENDEIIPFFHPVLILPEADCVGSRCWPAGHMKRVVWFHRMSSSKLPKMWA